VHGLRCYGNTMEMHGNPPGPLHAARRTQYACWRRLTPLVGDNIDVPAACAVPFRPYCGGVVTRTRYVSEYMLVLALRLVYNSIRRNCIARRQRAVSPAFSRPYRRLQASHHAGAKPFDDRGFYKSGVGPAACRPITYNQRGGACRGH